MDYAGCYAWLTLRYERRGIFVFATKYGLPNHLDLLA